jgi:hypothetical protein
MQLAEHGPRLPLELEGVELTINVEDGWGGENTRWEWQKRRESQGWMMDDGGVVFSSPFRAKLGGGGERGFGVGLNPFLAAM